MFEQNGKPRTGDGWCELGVRPPGRIKPNGQPALADVKVNANGDVALNNKGLSAFRSLADLPALASRLVPLHLADKVRGAAGAPDARIWSMGQGAFASGPLTGNLVLHASGGVHGSVCPSIGMPLADFQHELAATQNAWGIDEP